MFGEQPIWGQRETFLDSKSRICIPTFTKAEPGETLFITYDKDIDIYGIYSPKKFEERVEQLQSQIIKAKTKEDEIIYKIKFYEFCKSVLLERKVDPQNRIGTGTIFSKYKKLILIGASDHLLIEPIDKQK